MNTPYPRHKSRAIALINKRKESAISVFPNIALSYKLEKIQLLFTFILCELVILFR